jgi:hypothetical protein
VCRRRPIQVSLAPAGKDLQESQTVFLPGIDSMKYIPMAGENTNKTKGGVV